MMILVVRALGLWMTSLDHVFILWLLVVVIGKGRDDKGIGNWTESWMLLSLRTWQRGWICGWIWIDVLGFKEGKNKGVGESDWEC